MDINEAVRWFRRDVVAHERGRHRGAEVPRQKTRSGISENVSLLMAAGQASMPQWASGSVPT